MKWYRVWGYNRITISGAEKDRFIKLCGFHEITLYRLRIKDDYYTFDIENNNLQSLKKLAGKTDITLKIEKGKGIGIFLQKLRKRYLFPVFILLVFGIILHMGQFVWHVSLCGNQQLTTDMLSDFLNQQGCRIGTAKNDIDCELLENKLRDAYPYITWVCIQTSGSKLLVSVKENELSLDTLDSAKEEAQNGDNLICKEDGLITKLLLQNGCSKLKAGDEITAGEIIVEGKIPIYNITGDTVISYEDVIPEADLRIQTTQQYTHHVSRCILRKERTGRCVRFPYIVIGNRIFESSKEDCFEQEECVRTFRQLHLFGDFYLPVYYGAVEVHEVCEYSSLQSYQSLITQLETEYQEYHTNLIQDGCRLIEEQHSIFDTKEGLVMNAEMIVERKAELTAEKPAVMPQQDPDE